ncbi:MAG: phytoene/squalene synthase family protein [bacterium]
MKNTHAKDITFCKKTTRAYGTSYFISTYFFPKLLRERTWVLYAFVRYPDEIVDTEEKNPIIARQKILAWKNEWAKAYAGATDVHPILRANAVLWSECSIPFEYSNIFLDAMLQDTNKNRYQTYAELETYMYGSATVVGYMMSYIIGFTDNALVYAKALGEAFQLTNFLRDIKEDLARGRIYIPREDWARYHVTEADFQSSNMPSNMKKLILHEVERNEQLYSEALKGISLLNKEGRRAVRIALYLYKEIMEQIKTNPKRVWKERVRVSLFRKIYLIIKYF